MPIFVNDKNIFLLNTNNTSYCICVDPEGILRHIYWGKIIQEIENFDNKPCWWEQGFHPQHDIKREECSSFGSMRFKETSLKITYADGVRDFRYDYLTYDLKNANELSITLTDSHYPTKLTLHYKVYEEENIIEKWRTIENQGDTVFTIERIHSAECSLPGKDWKAINSNGMWNADFDPFEQTISGGKLVLESLRGATGHVANPSFILHKNGSETTGEIYSGALGWSGNFKIVLEQTPYDYLNILAGISDTDHEWPLKNDEKFITPSLYLSYSDSGFSGISQNMARFARKHIMPRKLADQTLPVLYNSWEAMYFDVNTDTQIKLAEKAAQIGAELFVMDDGWFGQRHNDHAGLGDWEVNLQKFPKGLTPLIDAVHGFGMKFGIWIEPEMVNPDSELFRNHPDWAYQYRTRPIMEGRYQYMLDLTRSDVRQYIIDSIDRLLRENKIDYIKWDMNRGMSEAASGELSQNEFKSIWYRHTEGFYEIARTLREKHPDVEWEACASGGGRVDYGAMGYFDEFWPSDNTDPLDRLSIQECYSYLYPIKYMRAWVTEAGSNGKRVVPLEFRLHSAMCGVLGIGVNLLKTSEEEMLVLKDKIAQYKAIRNIVQFGKIFRLASLTKEGIQAVQYNTNESALLFVFLDHPKRWKTQFQIRLYELDATSCYKYILNGETKINTGEYLMNMGLEIRLTRDYDSQLLHLEKIK